MCQCTVLLNIKERTADALFDDLFTWKQPQHSALAVVIVPKRLIRTHLSFSVTPTLAVVYDMAHEQKPVDNFYVSG